MAAPLHHAVLFVAQIWPNGSHLSWLTTPTFDFLEDTLQYLPFSPSAATMDFHECGPTVDFTWPVTDFQIDATCLSIGRRSLIPN
jgi:hypothetical protein